jgi:hypothetical protein
MQRYAVAGTLILPDAYQVATPFSPRSGTHDTYKPHAQQCEYCSPDRIREEREPWRRTRAISSCLSLACNSLSFLRCTLAEVSQWAWKDCSEDEAHLMQMTRRDLTELHCSCEQSQSPWKFEIAFDLSHRIVNVSKAHLVRPHQPVSAEASSA